MTLQPADRGDTTSLFETLDAAQEMAAAVGVQIKEPVADKGYHSNDVLVGLFGDSSRAYVSEPERGRRRWDNKDLEKELVYGNRRRLRGERSKGLQKKRAELSERSFAHLYETGGMHLRGSDNSLKRLLIQAAGFNLGLVMRRAIGVGTPRRLKDLRATIVPNIRAHVDSICRVWADLINPTHLADLLPRFRLGIDILRYPVGVP